MEFDILTIYPDMFNSFLSQGVVARALKRGDIKINVLDLYRFLKKDERNVDDRPFGGGPGMVLKLEPIYRAVQKINKTARDNSRVVLLSCRGRLFNQKKAFEYSKLDKLILICGRFEGVDERVHKYIADELLSIGNFILTGGELPAMVVVDAVARFLPGVLGKEASLKKGFWSGDAKGVSFPQYTRPEVFKPGQGRAWRVPKVLVSGNHQKILEWRKKRMKSI